MSYEATVRDFSLKVMDREGLTEHLNQILKQHRLTEYPCEDLEQALKHFLWANSVVIDSNDSFDELSICDIKYHEEDWQSIAPYLSGYIEWIGEDDAVWRDYFRDGKMESEYPEIIWPSEHFFTEKWCDEDVASQIQTFNISENDPHFNDILDEAKLRVTRCFDDKSSRNEQIKQIISDILYKQSRDNKDNS